MLDVDTYLQLDATALAAGIRAGEFSCADVTTCAIQRAEAVNPDINAIIAENYDSALAQAQSIDKDPALLNCSPMAGLPFPIKDLTAVAGLPHGNGSRLFAGNIASANAPIAQRYLDAGLLVLGKTSTPEFGVTLTTEPVATGITRNPWNLSFSTGGSSGGAAAAVAAGIVPVAHASDGGGSIRIPASCCGLFGLKPSRGLTVIENKLGDCWSGMSVGHVVSQTVRDSAAFLDLIRLQHPTLFPLPSNDGAFRLLAQQTPPTLRIAIQTSHPLGEEVDSDCLRAVRDTAALCETLGHTVEDIDTPMDYKDAVRAMGRIINLHVWQAVAPRLETMNLSLQNSNLESSTRIMAEAGSKVLADDYVLARDTLRQAELHMARFHQQFDVVISPVLAKAPAALGWLDMNSSNMSEYINRFKAYSGFTALFNGTGQPSMSVPMHRTATNLPVGVMVTGAWGQDALLLQLAAQLEQARPWVRFNNTL